MTERKRREQERLLALLKMTEKKRREQVIKDCYVQATKNYLLAVKEYQHLNGIDRRATCFGLILGIENIVDGLGYPYEFLPNREGW